MSDIDVDYLYNKCDEKYYVQKNVVDLEKDTYNYLKNNDYSIDVTLDIGTFRLQLEGHEVKLITSDQNVIDYYNATKFWPFDNITEEEIKEYRYKNNDTISLSAIDQWLAVSNKAEIN